MKISEVMARQEEKKLGGKSHEDRPRTPVDKRALKVIRTRETPNPNALQFVLNTQILERGNHSYSSLEDCGDDAMAKAVFELGSVRNVYIMKNFVTVTKSEQTGWVPFKNQIWETIDQKVKIYKSDEGEAEPEIDVRNFQTLPEEKKLQAVEMVLNRSIRSQLAQDGGGVDLKGIKGNDVLIHYQGACESCPSSLTGTLKTIESLIKQQLDPALAVKSV